MSTKNTLFYRGNQSVSVDFTASAIYTWIDRYVSSLKGRDEVIIDVDSTDDSTYGSQQL